MDIAQKCSGPERFGDPTANAREHSARAVRLTAAAALILLLIDATGVDARPLRKREAVPVRAPATQSGQDALVRTAAPSYPEPILSIVSIGDQRISVYGANGLMARSGVSTGTAGHATPTGIFSILQKNRHHESNIYSGAPMPYMQRITWSGIALHQGHLPGYPASHGCIRLPESFAQQLWGLTRLGQRVIVAPREAIVAPIAHSSLPVPVMSTPPETNEQTATRPTDRIVHHVALAAPAGQAATTLQQPDKLNPIAFAHALKVKAMRDARDAALAAKEALAVAAERSAEARRAIADLAALRRRIEALEQQLTAIGRAADQGQHRDTPEATMAAGEDIEHELEDLEDQLAFAITAERSASDAAFAAASAARAAEAHVEKMDDAVREASRRQEPLSVLVSRKEGRVFIRQGLKPVHDAEVSIRDPERPLGSHLLLATRQSGSSANELAWIAATVPNSQDGTGATAALDRIGLPAETRRIISERLWVGASLVITDFPISNETGHATDFIVLTK